MRAWVTSSRTRHDYPNTDLGLRRVRPCWGRGVSLGLIIGRCVGKIPKEIKKILNWFGTKLEKGGRKREGEKRVLIPNQFRIYFFFGKGSSKQLL